MTITARVQSQYFVDGQELIRLPPSEDQPSTTTRRSGRPWTADEHDRFLEALEMYPSGPWKVIAAHIATRTTRQTMTHAQKYREKIARRRRMGDTSAPQIDAFMAQQETLGVMSSSANATAAITIDDAVIDDTPYVDNKYAVDEAIIALLETYEPLELTADGIAGFEFDEAR